MLKGKKQFSSSINTFASKCHHLTALSGGNPPSVKTWALLENPLSKQELKYPCSVCERASNLATVWQQCIIHNRKSTKSVFPQNGISFCKKSMLCIKHRGSWRSPYLLVFFPSVWDFPSTSDSLRSSVGLWGSDLGNAVFKVSTMALTTICKSQQCHQLLNIYISLNMN